MELNYQGKTVQVPDFIIVGAPRSGTTALHRYLMDHPDVFVPAQKEPMFFCDLGENIRIESQVGVKLADWIIRTTDDYLALFTGAKPGQMIGEASTWYLSQYHTTIPNIKALYGERARDLRIVIMLRHPADRTWSHYNHNRVHKREWLPFDEAIDPDVVRERVQKGAVPSFDLIGVSRYTDQVRAYLDAFPRTRVWIFEEFYGDLDRAMIEFQEFLGLRPISGLQNGKVVNPSGSARNMAADFVIRNVLKNSWWKSMLKKFIPGDTRRKMKLSMIKQLTRPDPIPEDVRSRLCDQFAEEIASVEKVLGRRIPSWHAGESV